MPQWTSALQVELEAERAECVSAAACVTDLEEGTRVQVVELEAACAECVSASIIIRRLEQQLESMTEDAASAASTMADLQQHVQVVEAAVYHKQQVGAGWLLGWWSPRVT